MSILSKLGVIACLLAFCGPAALWSQTVIIGYIEDDQKQAVANINVIITPVGQTTIIAYAFSDDKGHFAVSFNTLHDSLDVSLSSLAYARQTKRIGNQTQEILFTLIPDVKQLETFTVRASPIVRKGDTLSYLVQSFAGRTDRSIEDVLRRMPGIEVEQGGRILYNGLPIEKFYVEGLDLMDGRYAPVSRSLPHEAVATVEILENHQPIEMLRDRISSQQASLNLRLKKKTTYAGIAKMGTGYGDEWLWSADVSPMAFTTQFQALASLQSNNAGRDIAQQIQMLGLQDVQLHPLYPGTHSTLSIPQPQPALGEQHRFLFNRSHLLNLNALLRLNKAMSLRVNSHLLFDDGKSNSTTKRSIVSPADSSEFNERLSNRLKTNLYRTTISLNSNTRKNYFENKLQLEAWRRDAKANMNLETIRSDQRLNQPAVSLSNNLRAIFPYAGQLIELKSLVIFESLNEALNVKPGMFENIFNGGNAFGWADQSVSVSRLYTHQSAGMINKWKRFTLFPSAGLVLSYRNMKTQLTTSPDVLNQPGTDYLNNNQIFIFRPYVKTGIEYKYKSLIVKAELPLSFHLQNATDRYHTGFNESGRLLLAEPKCSMQYQFGGFWQAGASFALIQRPAETDETFAGYVLTQYNRLFKNQLAGGFVSGQTFSGRIAYRNPITSLFQSVAFVNSRLRQPWLLSTILYEDGKTEVVPVDIPVITGSQSLQYNGSYYLSKANTTLSLKAIAAFSRRQQLLNEQAFRSSNAHLIINPQFNTRFSAWMHAEFGSEFRWLFTGARHQYTHISKSSKHQLGIYLFFSENTHLVFSNAFYNYGSGESFVSDLRFNQKLNEKRMELEIAANNIFNAKSFVEYYASAYTVFEYTYAMRPAQLLATVRFNL